MRSIFNKSLGERKRFVSPVHSLEKSETCFLKKKKKKRGRETQTWNVDSVSKQILSVGLDIAYFTQNWKQ